MGLALVFSLFTVLFISGGYGSSACSRDDDCARIPCGVQQYPRCQKAFEGYGYCDCLIIQNLDSNRGGSNLRPPIYSPNQYNPKPPNPYNPKPPNPYNPKPYSPVYPPSYYRPNQYPTQAPSAPSQYSNNKNPYVPSYSPTPPSNPYQHSPGNYPYNQYPNNLMQNQHPSYNSQPNNNPLDFLNFLGPLDNLINPQSNNPAIQFSANPNGGRNRRREQSDE